MVDIVSITDLKQNTSKIIERIKKSKASVVILQRSKPTAVIVDPDHYKMLESALEDLEDLQVIQERKNEPVSSFNDYFSKRFK